VQLPWRLPVANRLAPSLSTGGSQAQAPGAGGSSSSSRPPLRTLQDPRLPNPHDPNSAGLASGVAPVGGGSIWVFAALLVPFALTAPWWARRHRPSALRRLVGIALRSERPG
jgi:hypothetical protein